MISATLYSKFPTISYRDQTITDITIRLKFQKLLENNLVLFYPYTVAEGERADMVAYNYYGDASYTWLIYLANNIYNPTEEWPKSSEQFDKHIVATYGSVAAALEKIMFYRVEWASDESILNQSGYDALPSINKKYWAPSTGLGSRTPMYERTQVDWVIDTNRVVKLGLSTTTTVNQGDCIYQLTSGSVSAKGEVAEILDSFVFVKHIEGEFIAGGKTVFRGDTTIGTCTSAEIIANALAPEEANYWMPLTAYDYEMELNEAKKTIRLVDSSYIDTIERDLRLILAP